MRPALLMFIVIVLPLFSGCIGGDTEPSTQVDEHEQVISDMEMEITNLETLIDDANATILELEEINVSFNQIFSQLSEINGTILSLDDLQSHLDNISSQLAEAKVTAQNLQDSPEILNQVYLQLSEANASILELQLMLESYQEPVPTQQLPIIFESYNSTGSYMNHAKWTGGLWSRTTFDEDGIPLVNYSWGAEYVPTTAFHWGLVSYSMWLETGNQSNLENAIKVAEWAVSNQSANGAWNWGFSHNFSGGVLGELSSGWPNAMTQGLGMSFLVRMYSITNDSRYRDAALNASQPLQIAVDEGGVARKFNEQWWYEEYPTPDNGSYVLNGFIYTLIGLYDTWTTLGSNTSWELYSNGTESLFHMISLFDLGCNSSYDLVHHSIPGSAPNIARPGYHNLHITLLSVLNTFEDDYLVDVEERWLGYVMEECFASPNGANA